MSERDSGVDTGSESSESNSMSVETSPQVNKTEFNLLPKNEPQQCEFSEEFFTSQNKYKKYDHGGKIRRRTFALRRSLRARLNSYHFIKSQIKLRKAVFSNSVEQVKECLERCSDPNLSDEKGRTLLHFAASFGYTEIVKLLLGQGADPNLKDVLGNTPLHLAACISHIETVTLLLKAGTDVNTFNKSGQSPLQLAQSKLKLLRMSKYHTSTQLKAEVMQVLEMMQVYLQRSGQPSEVVFLNEFSNRIHFHQTREEVNHDLGDLLSSLSHLSL